MEQLPRWVRLHGCTDPAARVRLQVQQCDAALQPEEKCTSFCLSGVFREATTDFTVDARALTPNGGDHIKTLISNPSGSCTDALITDLGDGTYSVAYTPYEEGKRPTGPTLTSQESSLTQRPPSRLQVHTAWKSAMMALRFLKAPSMLPSLKAAIQDVSACTGLV